MSLPSDWDALALASSACKTVGKPLILKSETESTNDDVRAAAANGATTGYTVVADHQTAGRGRRGRVWHSPREKNLYLSILLRHTLPIEISPLLTFAAGVAVAKTCEAFVGEHSESKRVTIKWPNDVRIDGKKVCGILVEASLRSSNGSPVGTVGTARSASTAIVGIGINVHRQEFPEELVGIATTLEQSSEAAVSRPAVLRRLLSEWEAASTLMLARNSQAIVDAVRSRCDTIGARVSIEGVLGVATEIRDDGSLVVRSDDGAEHVMRSGEVGVV